MVRGRVVMHFAIGLICLAPASAQDRPAGPPADSTQQQHQMMRGLTDAPYVAMMVRHHEHGIEMARVEEARGASESVKDLAAKIRASQQKELAELKGHGAHHGGAAGMPGQAEGHRMMDQQSQTMMSRLKSATGAGLDHAFLEQMSKHHEMAISMTEGATLEDPQLKLLAQRMLEGQRRELGELKKALASHTGAR